MKEIKLKIKYNSQRDNYEWSGKLKYWSQCWYTSCIMFLSAFTKEAEKEEFERYYVDDTEALIGSTGIAEIVIKKYAWIRDAVRRGIRSGAFYLVHVEAIKQYLKSEGYNPNNVICKRPGKWSEVSSALKRGSPVVLSTSLTKSGHIVCIVGEDDKNWIVHDPYGNAYAGSEKLHDRKDPYEGYKKDINGAFVKYPKEWLAYFAGEKTTGDRGNCYIIFYSGKV